jgi:uncharacterized membrane protein YkvA (DUF1232 family)
MADEKKNWLGPYIPEGSFIREIVQQVKLVYGLMLDPRVHPVTKLIPLAALAYWISPVDLIMGVPGLSAVDDVTVLVLGMRFFLEFAPPDVVHEHLKRLTQQASVNWKVVDDPPAPPPPPEPPTSGEVVDGTYRVEEKKE